MQLRRFCAKTIQEALEKVKGELGDDAIILSTKNKSKRDRKTGKKANFVEIVAAVDKEIDEAFGRLQKEPEEIANVFQPRDVIQPERLVGEIEELKSQVAQLAKMVEGLFKGRGSSSDTGKTEEAFFHETGLHETVASCLGLDRKSETIIHGLLSRSLKEGSSWPRVISILRSFISNGLRQGPVAEESQSRCWWAFVGPTGVGKTTTLAKIAARLKFLCKKRGAFICVDGYRMGAIDQIKKYASLMDIPVDIAKTNKDLVRLFGVHQDKDFIFVDTTGRNPFTSSHKTELERLFDSVPGLMAQVMLSATCKREDLMGAISFYRQFPVAGWTLTKIDETRSLAASVFPLIEAEVPVSYVTNGQRVPEDIGYARGKEMAELTLEPLKGLGQLLSVPASAKKNVTVVPETL